VGPLLESDWLLAALADPLLSIFSLHLKEKPPIHGASLKRRLHLIP